VGLNEATLVRLASLVGNSDAARIAANARVAEQIEQRFKRRVDELLADLVNELLASIAETGQLAFSDSEIEERLGALLLEHELQTSIAAANSITPAEYVRAAARPDPYRPHWPSDLRRVRELWDQWRITGRLPGKTREQAKAVKQLYIRRVQQAWQKHGADFIAGEQSRVAGYQRKGTDVNKTGKNGRAVVWNPSAFNREYARAVIEKAAGVPRARAYTIVETETTRYYNTIRVNTYNAIETVIGYLFIAVRDSATTDWCKSRNGVVFMKGTALLGRNTPPCHYNCRGELLPLSRLNPTHRKLLEDMSLRAENRVLVPLLPEWNTDRRR
jgi:SPP1 gp7 family putative phage head morphogenesis protein